MTDEVASESSNDVKPLAESSPAGQDVTPADSSPSETQGVETTLLDRVKGALGQGSEKSPISVDGEGKPSSESSGTEGEDPDVPSEIKQLSEKAQDRFRDLVGKRKEVEAERDALKPKAAKLDGILSYMEKNRIAPQEFDNALELTRIIKSGDYAKALEVLTSVYREIADRAGKILPADLQEQVRLGYLTEQHAKELHESRTRATNLETRSKAEGERTERERADAEVTQTVNRSAQAADQWAKAKATSDPDWNLKADLVAEQVELDTTRRLQARESDWFPATKEEVVKRAEAALEVVEKRLKKFAPKPREQRVATGQPASPRSVAAPKSMLDAIRQSLNG